MQLFIIYPWLVVVLFLIFHFFLFFKVFLIFGVSMEVRPVLKTQSQTSCQPLDSSEFLYLRYKAWEWRFIGEAWQTANESQAGE